MDHNYITYKCLECGTVFIIPSECMSKCNNYIGCPMHGKHTHIIVVGAYDDLQQCMNAHKYKRNKHGAIEQNG